MTWKEYERMKRRAVPCHLNYRALNRQLQRISHNEGNQSIVISNLPSSCNFMLDLLCIDFLIFFLIERIRRLLILNHNTSLCNNGHSVSHEIQSAFTWSNLMRSNLIKSHEIIIHLLAGMKLLILRSIALATKREERSKELEIGVLNAPMKQE